MPPAPAATWPAPYSLRQETTQWGAVFAGDDRGISAGRRAAPARRCINTVYDLTGPASVRRFPEAIAGGAVPPATANLVILVYAREDDEKNYSALVETPDASTRCWSSRTRSIEHPAYRPNTRRALAYQHHQLPGCATASTSSRPTACQCSIIQRTRAESALPQAGSAPGVDGPTAAGGEASGRRSASASSEIRRAGAGGWKPESMTGTGRDVLAGSPAISGNRCIAGDRLVRNSGRS